MRLGRFASFALLCFLLAAAASALFYFRIIENPLAPPVLRVSFPSDQPAQVFDPANIQLAPEYIFLENIFSPLVEFNREGKVIAGLADRFEWRGSDLIFHIRKNFKTIDGHPITARDAALSLKRLLILSKSTQGNLRSLVCEDQNIQSLATECKGIQFNSEELILKPKKFRHFLLPLLTSMDFAVIPEGSIDPQTLKIIDYRNTTGPYYVEKNSPTGNIVLAANPSHYHFTHSIPKRVSLVPIKSDESIQRFGKGEIDHLTTVDFARSEQVISLSKSSSEYRLHSTINIRTLMSVFTGKGLKTLDRKQRLSIGRAIKQSLWEYFSTKSGYEPTYQIFPVFSEGGLDKQQASKIRELYDNSPIQPEIFKLPLKIRLVRLGNTSDLVEKLTRVFPKAEITAGGVPTFGETADMSESVPHLFICGPDMGFLEDMGSISYGIAAGHFDLNSKTGKEWLEQYQNMDNKEERLKMLKELHFRTLEKVITVPIADFPYTALVRKPWRIHLPTLFANNPLWLINRD